VSAKGRGAIAAQIVAVAREHGVAIRRDRTLAQLLGTLEIDSPIPVAAFAAVAEILVHLYRVDRQLAAHHGQAPAS
jgi:flagellar biosynthesis protein